MGSTCTFYDVTEGNIALPCLQANCYGSDYQQGLFGVLSTDASAFTPAYPTTAAWDLATGLGTINVANLLKNWAQVVVPTVSRGPTPPPSGWHHQPVPQPRPVSPLEPIA